VRHVTDRQWARFVCMWKVVGEGVKEASLSEMVPMQTHKFWSRA